MSTSAVAARHYCESTDQQDIACTMPRRRLGLHPIPVVVGAQVILSDPLNAS
jgi:hypothetical protein